MHAAHQGRATWICERQPSKYLLDTNVVSKARRGSPEAIAWIRSAKGRALHVSVTTLGEIMRGIQLKERKDPRVAAMLAEWLIALRELHRETIPPVTEAVALEWGVRIRRKPRFCFSRGRTSAFTMRLAEIRRSGGLLIAGFGDLAQA
jgi:predicted nucleic acid-binding protein